MIQTDGMITVAEAAKRLNRSIEQVRRYLREGKLKGERIGNQWFVDEAALKPRKPRPLIPRELIAEVKEIRQRIAERNPGYVFDSAEMLRRVRGEA
jgi:excisionase family DNA binding protein